MKTTIVVYLSFSRALFIKRKCCEIIIDSPVSTHFVLDCQKIFVERAFFRNVFMVNILEQVQKPVGSEVAVLLCKYLFSKTNRKVVKVTEF